MAQKQGLLTSAAQVMQIFEANQQQILNSFTKIKSTDA